VSAAGVARWRPGDDPAIVARALEGGALVAIPTESSYGLAVDPRDEAAVEAIFRIKGRSATKALPVVGATVASFVALGVDAADPALAWARARWPSALSVVVPLRAPIAASGGRASLAVRVPGHRGLRELLAALGRPLTATSANPAGEPSLADPEAVASWLVAAGADALLVDGGRLPGGAPSTLVTWSDGVPHVVRPGRVRIA
jgi:L-threonylcarbamoyladenylate synthase